MAITQHSLFPPGLPEGFYYQNELLSPDEERALVEKFAPLPFREFEFRGFLGKRRIVSYGWRYDFNVRELREAEEIPTFLLDLRQKAAKFAGLEEGYLKHVLVTEYSPGSAIGWHRDRDEFNDIIGLSLLTPACFALGVRRTILGARLDRAAASLGLCPPWCRTRSLAAQHPTR
jgi:alkylated DNA repair dioxygenase AlkB